jgi:YVTN family beta-propeller protein
MRLQRSRLMLLLTVSIVFGNHGSAQTVGTRLGFRQQLSGIAVNSVTNRIYLVAPSFGGPLDELEVIDGRDDRVMTHIPIAAGAYLPAVNTLTGRIYIGSCDTYQDPVPCFVTVVDGDRNKAVAKIAVTHAPGNGIQGIAVDPVANLIFVANANDNTVNVIDGQTNKLLDPISLGDEAPRGLALNPIKGILYAPLESGEVEMIATRSRKVISNAALDRANFSATVNCVTGEVFVINSELPSSAIQDPDQGELPAAKTSGPPAVVTLDQQAQILARINMSDSPTSLDVDPFTNLVFVANIAAHKLIVVNGKDHRVVATIPGIEAAFVAVNPSTKKVYISGGKELTVVSEK